MLTVKWLKNYLRIQVIVKPDKKKINEGRSLLCNNCTGGVILHELGFRFDTPTINTWIPDDDYLKFIQNLSFYKKEQIHIIPNQEPYVLGLVHDVHIHFMHETDPERAVNDWNRRFKRLDENNLYCLFVGGKNTTQTTIESIIALPVKQICVLTEKEYSIDSEKMVPLIPKRGEEAGGALNYIGKFSLHKRYDVFDFKTWLK